MTIPLLHTRRPAAPPTAGVAARQLQERLAEFDIVADLVEGTEVALLHLRSGLVIWCDGHSFSWWTGRYSGPGDRWREYAYAPVSDVETAARRVATRHQILALSHPVGRAADLGLTDPDGSA
ncbi:hypothetical protein [Thermoactinospora rubra]|uniref:hypothetical protein n=1 Tax=Thermoactinospora rubra TaxID=1088767 RepID=UPI000A0F501B|nr:hypothetical protein [Thermoactinospora rubra]